MSNFMPSLVSVGKIDGAPSRSHFSAEAVEAAANAILDARALVSPLVVKQTGFDTFSLLDGALAFHAAARARELDPRRVEKVLAFVADAGQEEALKRQQAILSGTRDAQPTETSQVPRVSEDSSVGARLDNFEAELRGHVASLRTQLKEERLAANQQLQAIAAQMPRAIDCLAELNSGDPRRIREFLAPTGLKGKTLATVIQNIQDSGPFGSSSEAVKQTKGLSAERLLLAIEHWSLFSRNLSL